MSTLRERNEKIARGYQDTAKGFRKTRDKYLEKENLTEEQNRLIEIYDTAARRLEEVSKKHALAAKNY